MSEKLSEQIWYDECQICFTYLLRPSARWNTKSCNTRREARVRLFKLLYPLTDFTALGLVWAIKKAEENDLI